MDSLAIYKDPNCRLVDLLRNYLFFFNDELKSDMDAEFIPDTKRLKRGINEILQSWSSVIMASIENNTNTAPYHPYMIITSSSGPSTSTIDLDDNYQPNSPINIGTNPFLSPGEFKAELSDGSTQESRHQHPQATTLNLIAELDAKKNSVNSHVIETNEIADNEENGTKMNENVSGGGSIGGQPDVEIDSSEKPRGSVTQHQQHIMTKNTNKLFRPILNFIGVDAPSGTLIDNLFKEFGTLLFGNLNIKSVHINILGSTLSIGRLFSDTSNPLNSTSGSGGSKPVLSSSSQVQFRGRSFYRYFYNSIDEAYIRKTVICLT